MSDVDGRVDLEVKTSVNVEQFINNLKVGENKATLTGELQLPTVASFSAFAEPTEGNSESTMSMSQEIKIHVEGEDKKEDQKDLPDTGLTDVTLYAGLGVIALGVMITGMKRKED